jgi:hypothetical protein
MAYIKEETKHEYLGAIIQVKEREKFEYYDPWRIITLEVDRLEDFSPKELRELGEWLIDQGKRIGKEYRSNGAIR